MRGICCLTPGIPGVSETIEVVSVVGRFLEHSRIYSFHRGDEHIYYIGSADLMPRNLDTRVELLVPVEDPELKAEIEDTLDRCLADDTLSWTLGSDVGLDPADGPDALGPPRTDGAHVGPGLDGCFLGASLRSASVGPFRPASLPAGRVHVPYLLTGFRSRCRRPSRPVKTTSWARRWRAGRPASA